MRLVWKEMIMESKTSYLTRFEWLIGQEGIRTLMGKSVFVLGIGGVGGYVCEALARSGVGKLILVDPDVVDITNINRQIIALHSTVGKKKVEVMKERILDISPSCEVLVYDTFLGEDFSLLEQCSFDFLVDCCDTVSTKKNIISYCLEHKIQFLTCLGTAKKIDPSLLEITELFKTYNDPLARILRKYVREKHLKGHVPVLFSSELPCKSPDGLGSSAFVPSSAGIMIASYVVHSFLQNEKK